jgi:aspartate kinase
MALLVQKFGGTSVGTIERIRRVARIVEQTRRQGNDVVVVVSAMGEQTDELWAMARAVNPRLPKRELDMLLTTGERQSMALLSMALQARGLDAVSFTGSQVGIITDDNHADARIVEIRGDRLRDALHRHRVPIVAGFQGVSPEREITTLGRGGSDTTAVALAAFLPAERCEIYTDVAGVFTENPREFPRARLLPEISYQEMLELASNGAQVLHPRACALAAKYRVKVRICSSFRPGKGTTIREEVKMQNAERKTRRSKSAPVGFHRRQNSGLERAFVRAITHSEDLCRFSLVNVPKVPKCLAQGVTQLAREKIPLVFFAHGVPTSDQAGASSHFDLSYIVPAAERARTEKLMNQVKSRVKAERLVVQKDLCSVSVVGPGVGSDVEIISELFTAIADLGIHVDAFTTAATKITVFVHRAEMKRTVAALLKRFDLRTR